MTARNTQTVDLSGYATQPVTGAEIQDGTITAAKLGFSTAGNLNSELSSNILGGRTVVARKPGQMDESLNMGRGFLSNGTDDSATYRLRYRINDHCTDVRLVFAGYTAIGNLADAYTVEAAIEDLSGNVTRITFGGSNSKTVNPGDFVLSDAVSFQFATRNTEFYLRTYVSVASGKKWPTFYFQANFTQAEANNRGTGAVNYVMSSGTTNLTQTATERTFHPLLIVGRTRRRLGVGQIFGKGDSIMAASADNGGNQNYPHDFPPNADTAKDPYPESVERSLRYRVPYIQNALIGETMQTAAANIATWGPLLKCCDVLLLEYGSNDRANGRSAAQMEADFTTISAYCAANGIKLVAFTVPPRTTSSDNWATTSGQTAVSGESNRVTYNNWLRAGGDGNVWALVDFADIVESARDSGKWSADGSTANLWTADGVHPSDYAHSVIWTKIPQFDPVAADLLNATYNGSDLYSTKSADYTLIGSDAGTIVELNYGSPHTLTVPPNSAVPFPVGTRVTLRRMGAQTTTVAAGVGVTIRSKGGTLTISPQYGQALLTKRGTDEWVLTGDLA